MEEDYQQHPGQHQSYCYTNPQDFVQPNQDEDEMLHMARHEIYQLCDHYEHQSNMLGLTQCRHRHQLQHRLGRCGGVSMVVVMRGLDCCC